MYLVHVDGIGSASIAADSAERAVEVFARSWVSITPGDYRASVRSDDGEVELPLSVRRTIEVGERDAGAIARLIEEIDHSRRVHPNPMANAHHALGVIMEEFDELKAEIYAKEEDQDPTAMADEAIDIACACIRFVEEVCEGMERSDVGNFIRGDRVMVNGAPHMEGHTTGSVKIVHDGPAYGIMFDGATEVHKWYVGDELMRDGMERGDAAPVYVDPPKEAQEAARAALAARETAPKSKRGGLDTKEAGEQGIGSGVARARDIAAGKQVDARRVAAFFSRHEGNYEAAKANGLTLGESPALQAWGLWGGNAMRRAAESAMKREE